MARLFGLIEISLRPGKVLPEKSQARSVRVLDQGSTTADENAPGQMVSDERRLQLNREFFGGEVHRQREAYLTLSPEPWQLLWRSRVGSALATLRALLPDGGSVLDVGCGTGALSVELARKGYQVTAVDLIAAMVEQGRLVEPSVNWLNAPFTDQVGSKKSFDAVVSLGYLEYQERAGKELVRMGRLLKPGGHLLLSVPNTLSGQFGYGAARALFRLGKEPEHTMVRHSFTPERLQRLLGMAGFILMDYQWMSPEAPELALGGGRTRAFWNHRFKDRFQAEILTLSRTYRSKDTDLS